jgi:hypothetical protein
MYLIHNAYGGTLCIIKSSSSSSGDKGNEGDIEASRLLKANNSNLFVSNVHNFSARFLQLAVVCEQLNFFFRL